MNLFEKIEETAAFIRKDLKYYPTVGIILGSGLGSLMDIVEKESEIAYHDIPNFNHSTVKGHHGKLIFGKIGAQQVMLMAGRFHYYEGYGMEDITFPVRVMKALGVHTLIVSNAAGGTHPDFIVGDLMIINDHINMYPSHPLRGPNDERLGTRFPDMGKVYDEKLRQLAKNIAKEHGFNVKEGVYMGLQGPTFETPAEYRMVRLLGADAVGMSTVPEAIVARHGGMRIFAMSVITDVSLGDMPLVVSHEEVLEAAHAAAPKMATLVAELVKRME